MKLSDLLNYPKQIVGAAAALGLIALFFGVSFVSPGKRIDQVEVRIDTLSTRSDVTLELLTDMVRGECLESCAEKLGLQGLLAKCSALGIERTMGDARDVELGC